MDADRDEGDEEEDEQAEKPLQMPLPGCLEQWQALHSKIAAQQVTELLLGLVFFWCLFR